jgi:Iron-containing redox enzyme
MQTADLLKRCAEKLAVEQLGTADLDLLEQWNGRVRRHSSELTERFVAAPLADWEELIVQHDAHRHAWYDFFSHDITIDEAAAFLLENKNYPAFLRLLEKIAEVQICAEAVDAIAANIADEHEPEPHAELMRRLMQAVRARARHDLALAEYPSLVDRTLVFYYGYYCNPWHLVGSVFATECMGTRRVVCMDQGLRRLGLSGHELAFTIIHSQCDDHHASDWLERVIIPTVALQPGLRRSIAEGIATCLVTSSDYLSFLLRRVTFERATAPSDWGARKPPGIRMRAIK